jgi:hypothetical protein
VVVVEVAGTAGTAGVVVVVLVVVVGAAGVAQPDSDNATTAAAKHAMMSVFISMIFVCLLFQQHVNTSSVGRRLWGETLPRSKCQTPRPCRVEAKADDVKHLRQN